MGQNNVRSIRTPDRVDLHTVLHRACRTDRRLLREIEHAIRPYYNTATGKGNFRLLEGPEGTALPKVVSASLRTNKVSLLRHLDRNASHSRPILVNDPHKTELIIGSGRRHVAALSAGLHIMS